MSDTMPSGQRYELPPEEFADYVANRAADIADKRISRRETLWRGLTAAIFAILGLLGYSGLTSNIDQRLEGLDERVGQRINTTVPDVVATEVETLQEPLTDKLELRLRETIDASVDSKLGGLSERIAANSKLSMYLAVSNRIHLSQGSYKSEDGELGLQLLQELSADKQLVERREFVIASENFVDSINAAFAADQMDSFYEHAGRKLSDDRGIWITLLSHYGWRVLGEPVMTADLRRKFVELRDNARKHDLFEFALFFELMLNYRDHGSVTPEGTKLVAAIKDLDAGSRKNTGILIKDLYQVADRDTDDFLITSVGTMGRKAIMAYELVDFALENE